MIAHGHEADHDQLPMADVDTAGLWAESGCQTITHHGVAVPVRLVATVAGVADALDEAGVGVTARFGAHGLGALSERAATLLFESSGRTSCGGGSRLVRAQDGWLAVTLARPTDRELLPAWLGLAPDAACVVSNADPWSDVARRVAEGSAAQLAESARVLGLACAVVGEVWPSPAVLRRSLGEASPRDPRGLRVLNLGALWAGPLAAHLLARLGADVVCVESSGRPDGARQTPHWFDAMHVGQRSVALDFRDDAGVAALSQLLAAADVVIEGSRPRALEQLGVSALDMVARGPRVWVSITGYGREPATAMRVALGDDAAAAGGLVGWIADGPMFIADAVADPLAGLVAARAVVDAVQDGGRWLLDIALARVASAVAPRPGDAQASPRLDPRPGRPIAPTARSFVLGADTEEVLRSWIGRPLG